MARVGKMAAETALLFVVSAALALAGNSLRTSKSVQLSKNYFETGADRVKQLLEQRTRAASSAAPKPGSATVAAATQEPNVPQGTPAEFGFAESPPKGSAKAPTDADQPSSDSGAGHEVSVTSQENPPADARPPTAPAGAAAPRTSAPVAPPRASAAAVKKIEHPYQEATFEDLVAMLNDPKFAQGLFVVVDARSVKEFADGHIRGAIQADHYELEDYVDVLTTRTLPADKVVVYCNGGDCEDSVFMCGDLLELGLAYEKIYLYAGGWEEWQARAASELTATGTGGGS